MAKLSELMLGPAAGRDFTFEHARRDGTKKQVTVHIRPLTASEMDRARLNAEVYLKSLDPSGSFSSTKREEVLFDAEQIETLSFSLRNPSNVDSVWAGPAELRDALSTSTISVLLRAYHDVVDEIGPSMSTLNPQRYEQLVEACAKDASDRPLLFCDSRTRRDFIASIALELWTSRTDKSLPTSDSSEREIASSKTGESENQTEPSDET